MIPDFIPVLGQLDDLLLVPAGLWLALRLIPAPIMQEARQRAAEQGGRPPRSRAGTLLTVLVYALLYATALWLAWRWWTD